MLIILPFQPPHSVLKHRTCYPGLLGIKASENVGAENLLESITQKKNSFFMSKKTVGGVI